MLHCHHTKYRLSIGHTNINNENKEERNYNSKILFWCLVVIDNLAKIVLKTVRWIVGLNLKEAWRWPSGHGICQSIDFAVILRICGNMQDRARKKKKKKVPPPLHSGSFAFSPAHTVRQFSILERRKTLNASFFSCPLVAKKTLSLSLTNSWYRWIHLCLKRLSRTLAGLFSCLFFRKNLRFLFVGMAPPPAQRVLRYKACSGQQLS